MDDLRKTAIGQLRDAGFADPSEQAIQSRLRTLLEQKGPQVAEPGRDRRGAPKLLSPFSKTLALIQTFCQGKVHEVDRRRMQKRKGRVESESPNEIPYYFAAIPDDYVDHFARYLPASATPVLLVLWRYSKQKMQTWVSLKTICEKAGLSRNTVRRDLNLLAECKIVVREPAGGRDFSGRVIRKEQGDKYWLNWPVAWDRDKARDLEWRNRCGDKSVDK
jgi:hypothetical protein